MRIKSKSAETIAIDHYLTMEMETMLELEPEAKPKPHTLTLLRPEPPLAIQAINKVQ